jgi:hypothetical protein
MDRYAPSKTNTFSDLSQYQSVWLTWLQQLGIDDIPYQIAWKRGIVEAEKAWACEPSEKRRVVEKFAILLKYGSLVNIHLLPLREPTAAVKGLHSLLFHEIERGYFFDIRTFASFEDLDTRRKAWLAAVGFSEAQHHTLPQTSQQTDELNQLYQTLPVLRRRAIEAHAKFLKLLLNPPIPSWGDLEAQTEIYPASCFTSHFEYKTKRKEWLQSLGLDFWPFSYVNTQTKYNEVAEVAWSEMVVERRSAILGHAKMLKDGMHPYVNSWSVVEDIFGYSLKIDFGGNEVQYRAKRRSWNIVCLGQPMAEADSTTLERMWAALSPELKQQVLILAKREKEKFCTERLKQEAEINSIPQQNVRQTSQDLTSISSTGGLPLSSRSVNIQRPAHSTFSKPPGFAQHTASRTAAERVAVKPKSRKSSGWPKWRRKNGRR